MDFTSRGERSSERPSQQPGNSQFAADNSHKKSSRRGLGGIKNIYVVLLISIAVLLAALTAIIAFTDTTYREQRLVDKDKIQAVFLDSDQVYFGKVRSINNETVILTDIYYLRIDQPVQPDQTGETPQINPSLEKLGCELHGPQDIMVINRAHVMFWENLKEEGQVSQAIKQFVAENPDGQNCEEIQQAVPDQDNAQEMPEQPGPEQAPVPEEQDAE